MRGSKKHRKTGNKWGCYAHKKDNKKIKFAPVFCLGAVIGRNGAG